MSKKLTAFLFSLALSFGVMSAHAGLGGGEQQPGGAPPAEGAPGAPGADEPGAPGAPGADDPGAPGAPGADEPGAPGAPGAEPGAPGEDPGAPPAATPSPDEDLSFDELDTDGDGRISRAEAAAEQCLAEAFDEVADDPQEGMTEDEFEEAKEEHC